MKKSLLHPILLLLYIVFLLPSCKEDEEDEHPALQTLEITTLSSYSVVLKANITNKGKFPIMDYGFIYGASSDLNENWGTKISLGKDITDNMYTKQVDGINFYNQYNSNRMLYARAYLTNSKGTVYGTVVSVTMPSPNVQSIIPTSGKTGDRITINGQFFTTNIAEIEVIFGNVRGTIIEASSSKIIVEIPSGISNNYYNYYQIPVVLNMPGQSLNVTSSFRIIPSVKDFSPKEGSVGTVITISGENLYNYYNYYNSIRVLLGQIEVPVSNYNHFGIQVTVPKSVTTEKVAITVIIDGVTTVLPGEFTITPPVISSMSPSSGFAGSSFSIFGSNFPANVSYYDNYVTVKMGDVPVSVSTISTGQLTLNVPADMPAGDYKVKVTTGPHTVEVPQTYKVIVPSITGFSPKTGSVGKEVVLQGVFQPSQSYQVYFGNVAVYGYSATSTSLRVNVPTGVDPGKVKISLQYGNQSIVADDEFTVVLPVITSFTPESGVAGTVVTITGKYFNPNTWTTVKFGTIETNVMSVTETTIRVMVPSNVSAGAMKLSVNNNGQTIVGSENFTVTN